MRLTHGVTTSLHGAFLTLAAWLATPLVNFGDAQVGSRKAFCPANLQEWAPGPRALVLWGVLAQLQCPELPKKNELL